MMPQGQDPMQSLPPEMMGGGPAEMMMGGGEPGPGPQQMPALEHLRIAIEHAQAALQAEPDDADSQALAKIVQGLYAILANRQKEHQQLLGGGNLRALSRR